MRALLLPLRWQESTWRCRLLFASVVLSSCPHVRTCCRSMCACLSASPHHVPYSAFLLPVSPPLPCRLCARAVFLCCSPTHAARFRATVAPETVPASSGTATAAAPPPPPPPQPSSSAISSMVHNSFAACAAMAQAARVGSVADAAEEDATVPEDEDEDEERDDDDGLPLPYPKKKKKKPPAPRKSKKSTPAAAVSTSSGATGAAGAAASSSSAPPPPQPAAVQEPPGTTRVRRAAKSALFTSLITSTTTLARLLCAAAVDGLGLSLDTIADTVVGALTSADRTATQTTVVSDGACVQSLRVHRPFSPASRVCSHCSIDTLLLRAPLTFTALAFAAAAASTSVLSSTVDDIPLSNMPATAAGIIGCASSPFFVAGAHDEATGSMLWTFRQSATAHARVQG